MAYTRRANGRIKDVKATFNGTTTTVVASANYYPFGPPRAIGYGNGMVQVRTLDTAYSPGYFELADATSYDGYDGQGYTVGNDGNITQITDDLDAAHTRDYAYDDLDRLTWDSKVSATSPSYTYDANGNRLTRTAGSYAAQSFSYMTNSNRETNTSYDGMGNSSRNLETYDAAGRLDSATANGDTLSLAYNGIGELARTELTRADFCTNAVFTIAIDDFVFTPDGHALHVRTANTAAVSVDYLWLDDLPVAQFQDSYDTQGVYIGTEATYLHSDHLGTPRIGTNASKQITWRNRSDAFGIAELSGSAVVRLRFPGQLSLGVAGLNYNYYRDYDPKVGRYVESDPIGLDGGVNTYAYVANRPTGLSDPLGLDVTIQYFPGRQGHVGIGVNSPQTVGLYPRQQSLAVAFCGDTPGEVVPDVARQTPLALKRAYSFTIKTSPAQDLLIQQYLDQAQANRNATYNLCNNQCADFVRGALIAGKIPIPEAALKTIGPLPIPLDFFSNLRTGLEQR